MHSLLARVQWGLDGTFDLGKQNQTNHLAYDYITAKKKKSQIKKEI